MSEQQWNDPEGWAIGDWSKMTPKLMRGYSEEFLNYVSEQNGGGRYDTWARDEIARRQSERLATLVLVLNVATVKVETEVKELGMATGNLAASSDRLENLTKTLKNLTWALIVLTFFAVAIPIGIEVWKASHEPHTSHVSEPQEPKH
jgi:hypothetical protein